MTRPLSPLSEGYMDALRALVTRKEPQTKVVVVLHGSPEQGLAVSVSSSEAQADTRLLLAGGLQACIAALDEELNGD